MTEQTETGVHFRQNSFGLWIIQHPATCLLGWSGSRWAKINSDGLPAGPIQICNFTTRERAEHYAKEHRL